MLPLSPVCPSPPYQHKVWKWQLVGTTLRTFPFETSLFSVENGVWSVISTNSTLRRNVNITLDEEIPVGKTIAECQTADEDNLGGLTFGLEAVDDYFAVDKGRLRTLLP